MRKREREREREKRSEILESVFPFLKTEKLKVILTYLTPLLNKDGNLNGYQKKKYVCKLLYMYLLGYEVEFGHLEAVNLLSSTKYSEKYMV